ncbi:MAG: hypothetical protein K2H64_10060 [Desulfovibrio sp.]|nr:hypothetical protein [Desulfovibrio sp.]
METYVWLQKVNKDIGEGIFKRRNERHKVGQVGEEIREKINRLGVNLETAEISVSDGDLAHARRETKEYKLPDSVWEKLPVSLDRPKHIFWDNEKPGIIYVIEVEDGLGKIVVLPNYKVGKGSKAKITNNVRTGRKIKGMREFFDPVHFTKLK